MDVKNNSQCCSSSRNSFHLIAFFCFFPFLFRLELVMLSQSSGGGESWRDNFVFDTGQLWNVFTDVIYVGLCVGYKRLGDFVVG